MSHDQRYGEDLASNAKNLKEATGMRPFKLTELTVDEGCREIKVEGELDLAVAEHLQQALASYQGDHILISLESCQFIDSTGIAVIVEANRSNDSRVVLHSACDQVLRILQVTGLTSDGLVFADRDEALSAVDRTGP